MLCVRFSSSGKYLASCSRDKTIIIWDTKVINEDIKMIHHIKEHTKEIKEVNFSNDEKFLVSGSSD